MVLADANVLLEILLPARPRFSEAVKVLSLFDQVHISMLSVHLILHFGLKEGLLLNDIVEFLGAYIKEDLLTDDYEVALELLRGSDHEDALQLAVATRLGCKAIITFDQDFAKLYAKQMKFVLPA